MAEPTEVPRTMHAVTVSRLSYLRIANLSPVDFDHSYGCHVTESEMSHELSIVNPLIDYHHSIRAS